MSCINTITKTFVISTVHSLHVADQSRSGISITCFKGWCFIQHGSIKSFYNRITVGYFLIKGQWACTLICCLRCGDLIFGETLCGAVIPFTICVGFYFCTEFPKIFLHFWNDIMSIAFINNSIINTNFHICILLGCCTSCKSFGCSPSQHCRVPKLTLIQHWRCTCACYLIWREFCSCHITHNSEWLFCIGVVCGFLLCIEVFNVVYGFVFPYIFGAGIFHSIIDSLV